MPPIRPALDRARALFRRRINDVDMSEEIQMHVDALTERNIASGMSGEEARTAALREFGGVEQIKERCRDERVRGFTWFHQIVQDLRYAKRQMLKAPGFTAVAVISLGVAMGVNTAIFTLVDAVLLRTLPVKDPQQLSLLSWEAKSWPAPFSQTGGESRFSFSYPAFARLRQADPTFANVFAFVPTGFGSDNATAVIDGEPFFVQGLMVSGNYFSAMGAEPILGRGFRESDETRAQSNVAVISHSFWISRFGSSPDAIGRNITINATPFTVVGVAPEKFYGIVPTGSSIRPDVWVPISEQPTLRPWSMQPVGSSSVFTANNWICLNLGARLAPSADRAATVARLETNFRAFVGENWIQATADDLPRLKLIDAATSLAGLRRYTVRPLVILMYAVGLVLLIACANLASLLLARENARHKEISVRSALGASRARILRQLLTESILLGVLGGALGLLIAAWGSRALVSLFSPDANRMAFEVVINARVFAYTAALSLLTGVLFGLIPAWRGARADLMAAMKQRTSGGNDRNSHRVGKSLVAGQLAVSLVLMISAGLFGRTLHYMEHRNLGFDGENLLLFGLDPTRQGIRGPQLQSLFERLRQSIALLPDVENVTLYEQEPFSGSNNSDFRIEGSTFSPPKRIVRWAKVGPNFCKTMRIPVVLGRDFSEEDRRGATRVGIVNETFVRTFLPNETPLGRHFVGPERDVPIEIVGVVPDVELTDLHSPPLPQAFMPYLQGPLERLNTMYFEVRTSGDPLAATSSIRSVITRETPNTPLIGLATQTERTAAAMAVERMFARLAWVFSGATLLLSCIGLYGTLAYQVSRRVPEIGLRMALGATPRVLMRWVISQSLRIVSAGVVIGLLLAAGATRLLRTMLYGVGASDPYTYFAASLLMIVIALLACWIPARRAARVDPLTSLRAE